MKLPPYVHFDKTKRFGNPYYYVIRVGSKIKCKRGFGSPDAAYIAALQFKSNPVEEKVTFDEVVKRCLQHLQQSFVFETVEGYRSNYEKYIRPFLSVDLPYLKIDDGRVNYWREKICKFTSLGVQNKNRLITVLKHIYNYANIYLELDNKALLRVPKFIDEDLTPFFEHKETKKYISLPDLETLLKATETPFFKLMFLIAYTCGCRVGEIRGLTVDCYKEGKLSIVKQVQGKGTGTYKVRKLKSKSSKRICFLVPAVVELLENHFFSNKLRETDFIFFSPNSHKKPCSGHYINIGLRKAVIRSKLDEGIHFHLFRHSLSTYLSQSGIRSAVIADLLGHASDATTKKYYIHTTEKELETVLKLLSSGLKF